MRFTDYSAALTHLLSPEEISDTGWGTHFWPVGPAVTALALPHPDTVVHLDARGLRRQFVCGYVTVDFAARVVTFTEANLREGCDEHVFTRTADAAWWQAALALAWPIPEERS